MIPLASILLQILIIFEIFKHCAILANAIQVVITLLLQSRDAAFGLEEGHKVSHSEHGRIDKDNSRNTKPYFTTPLALHDFRY